MNKACYIKFNLSYMKKIIHGELNRFTSSGTKLYSYIYNLFPNYLLKRSEKSYREFLTFQNKGYFGNLQEQRKRSKLSTKRIHLYLNLDDKENYSKYCSNLDQICYAITLGIIIGLIAANLSFNEKLRKNIQLQYKNYLDRWDISLNPVIDAVHEIDKYSEKGHSTYNWERKLIGKQKKNILKEITNTAEKDSLQSLINDLDSKYGHM